MKRTLRWLGVLALIGIAVGLAGCAIGDSAPQAAFTWTPSDPIARSDVLFTDDSTDSGGWFSAAGVVAWNWDFGDSDTSSSQNPKHQYEKGDTYTVRLTVTDAAGLTGSKEKTITVNPSMNGTWSGFFDNGANRLAMTLNINHSATGGIGGSVSIVVQNFTIQSASLAGDQVTIMCLGGLTLEGTLSANQRSINGWWSVNGAPGWTWSVTLGG